MNLSVKVGSIIFKNPLILASGILATTGSIIKRISSISSVGGIVTKSLTYYPRKGYNTPIIVGVKTGLINAVGLTNPGYKYFLEKELPIMRGLNIPIIISLAGNKVKELIEMCSRFEESGVDGIELNLSCPHAEKYGIEVLMDYVLTYRIISEVKSVLKIPLIVKIGFTDNLVRIAKTIEKAGADAISAINTIKAMAIDIYTRRPVLSNKFGGLSGPAIHPIAVRIVYELYEILNIPIIGVGGVEDWRDAIEFFLAGACAVQIGSSISIYGLKIFEDILKGIKEYLSEYSYRDIKDIVGLAHEE
ncbi:MAG TPA: dihydroorotate dehydrogenase [Thermoprotei archaeon]|nr:dihydroorotate dehydrogenase [Thermoprotei archaeon]